MGRRLTDSSAKPPNTHEHTGTIRRQFKIGVPKTASYLYGEMSPFERRLGLVRDERAWTAVLEYADCAEPSSSQPPQLAALYLRPCVSRREADRALDQIFASFNQKSKRRRPHALNQLDRQILRMLFELAEKRAGKHLRPADLIRDVDFAYKVLNEQMDVRRLSKKTIEKQCELWRKEIGRPTR